MTEIPEHILKRARVERDVAVHGEPLKLYGSTKPGNLVEYEGDLLIAQVDAIAHQTNCISNGVSGLASFIFKKWPNSNTYSQNPAPHKYSSIEVFPVRDATFRSIVNMYSQLFPGVPAPVGCDDAEGRLWAFRRCLKATVDYMNRLNLTSVAFPKLIGCGLAGGDWVDYYRAIWTTAENNSRLQFHIIEKTQ